MGTTDTPFVLNTLRADQMTHPDAAHTVLTPTWTKSAVGNITLMRTSTTRDKAYEVNAHNFLHKDAVTNHVRLRLMTWLRTLDDNATTSQP